MRVAMVDAVAPVGASRDRRTRSETMILRRLRLRPASVLSNAERIERTGQTQLTAAMPNEALERDATKSVAPLS